MYDNKKMKNKKMGYFEQFAKKFLSFVKEMWQGPTGDQAPLFNGNMRSYKEVIVAWDKISEEDKGHNISYKNVGNS